jgi:hypothetical protein
MSGVKPGILVINSFEDKINGRDPQLDRAIEEIRKTGASKIQKKIKKVPVSTGTFFATI